MFSSIHTQTWSWLLAFQPRHLPKQAITPPLSNCTPTIYLSTPPEQKYENPCIAQIMRV